MSFIRVSARDNKCKIDLNSVHIVSFSAGRVQGADVGSDIELTTGEDLYVNESPRQLRGFIKKAQGTLPAPAVSDDDSPAPPVA